MDSRDELILALVDRLATKNDRGADSNAEQVIKDAAAIKALGIHVDELATERNALQCELDKLKRQPVYAPKPTPKRDALLAKLRLIANEKNDIAVFSDNYTIAFANLMDDNINLSHVREYIAEEDAQ